MSNIPIVFFGNIRETALEQWKTGTGRSLMLLSTVIDSIPIDTFEFGDFECNWQVDACSVMGDCDFHVPHFCSLGDWAGNITDTLTDFRFDRVPIGMNDIFDQSLFRYYTRLMLVTSELLTDFQDLLIEAFGYKKKTARQRLSTSTIDVKVVFEYINSICKHKIGQPGRSTITKLHQCNQHLPFFFEDCGQVCTFSKPLGMNNLSETKPDGIIVPKLQFLISTILNGYQTLDQEIQNKRNEFKTFVSAKGESMP